MKWYCTCGRRIAAHVFFGQNPSMMQWPQIYFTTLVRKPFIWRGNHYLKGNLSAEVTSVRFWIRYMSRFDGVPQEALTITAYELWLYMCYVCGCTCGCACSWAGTMAAPINVHVTERELWLYLWLHLWMWLWLCMWQQLCMCLWLWMCLWLYTVVVTVVVRLESVTCWLWRD